MEKILVGDKAHIKRTIMVERADLFKRLNGLFVVKFHNTEITLIAKDWDDAQVEAKKVLNKLFPDVNIIID